MNSLYIISPIIAFLITYIFIPVFRKAAIRVQLVDKPNHRKVHTNAIPLIGGISIFAASTLSLGLALPFKMELLSYGKVFIAMTILLIVGVIDDRLDLRATLKLAIQLVLAHFIFAQGIKIESLHGLLGIYQLAPWLQYLLTVIIITGVVNAFNLMDGIDGLAAGLALVGFSVFTLLSALTGQYMLTLIFLTIIGALIAFLRFNLSSTQKIFMGDAGSLIIGFFIVVAALQLLQAAQGTTNITTVTLGVVAVMLIPVFDALRVFRKRAKTGKSPFSADKTHLHHLLLATGLKHKYAAFSILAIMAVLMVIGYLSFQVIGLTVAVIIMLLGFFIFTTILQFNSTLIHWKKEIRKMEHVSAESNLM